jgi:protein phosphatase
VNLSGDPEISDSKSEGWKVVGVRFILQRKKEIRWFVKKAKTERSILLGKPQDQPEYNKIYFDIAADSHKGLSRPRNEDSFIYSLDCSDLCLLAAVADGIGGNNNGDVAGNLALKMLLQQWRSFQVPRFFPQKAMTDFLKKTIMQINRKIHEINELYEWKSPMGTTIAAIVFLDDCIITAHAGDSRIYRLRKEQFSRLTFDHNIVNDLTRSGEPIPKYLDDSSYGRMLTQSLGPNTEVEPEITILDLTRGDRFLICSDGLTTHVSDFEIADTLENEDSSANAVKTLLRLTLHRGAKDNVTMISVYT